MKTSKIFKMLVALALLVCGCSDDLGVQLESRPVTDSGQTVRIGVSLESENSRLAYQDSDSKVILTWENGDVLKVLNSSQENSVTDFTLKEGEGVAYGVFEGKPAKDYTNGDTLHALFHNKLTTNTDVNSDGNVNISLAEQDGTLKEDYQLMYGAATYYEGNTVPAIKLKHLTSVLKVTIPTDKTIKKLILEDGSQWTDWLRSEATLLVNKIPDNATSYNNVKLGDLVYCRQNNEDNSNNQVVVEGTFEPNINGEVVIYVYVLPVKLYTENGEGEPSEPYITPTFTVWDENNVEYVGTTRFSDKYVESGKMYSLSTSIFPIEEFASGTGQESDPYVIKTARQLYSLMLRCTSKEEYNYNTNYSSCHYKLGNDIELDGSLSWTSFDFDGTFDGAGCKITGIMQNAMFDDLHEATIKNLTLDLDELTYAGYENMGRLAKLANNSKIINCVNNSDISSVERDGTSVAIFGGLVAIMEYNSQMIGCVNTGDIKVESREMLGGLVGDMRHGATMEACYSTGNITLAYESQTEMVYVGGLVGSINYHSPASDYGSAKMTSCWNNMTIAIADDISNYNKNDIAGFGIENNDYLNCFKVSETPNSEQINMMNSAMTNGQYKFDENGKIVPNSSTETEQ